MYPFNHNSPESVFHQYTLQTQSRHHTIKNCKDNSILYIVNLIVYYSYIIYLFNFIFMQLYYFTWREFELHLRRVFHIESDLVREGRVKRRVVGEAGEDAGVMMPCGREREARVGNHPLSVFHILL